MCSFIYLSSFFICIHWISMHLFYVCWDFLIIFLRLTIIWKTKNSMNQETKSSKLDNWKRLFQLLNWNCMLTSACWLDKLLFFFLFVCIVWWEIKAGKSGRILWWICLNRIFLAVLRRFVWLSSIFEQWNGKIQTIFLSYLSAFFFKRIKQWKTRVVEVMN